MGRHPQSLFRSAKVCRARGGRERAFGRRWQNRNRIVLKIIIEVHLGELLRRAVGEKRAVFRETGKGALEMDEGRRVRPRLRVEVEQALPADAFKMGSGFTLRPCLSRGEVEIEVFFVFPVGAVPVDAGDGLNENGAAEFIGLGGAVTHLVPLALLIEMLEGSQKPKSLGRYFRAERDGFLGLVGVGGVRRLGAVGDVARSIAIEFSREELDGWAKGASVAAGVGAK